MQQLSDMLGVLVLALCLAPSNGAPQRWGTPPTCCPFHRMQFRLVQLDITQQGQLLREMFSAMQLIQCNPDAAAAAEDATAPTAELLAQQQCCSSSSSSSTTDAAITEAGADTTCSTAAAVTEAAADTTSSSMIRHTCEFWRRSRRTLSRQLHLKRQKREEKRKRQFKERQLEDALKPIKNLLKRLEQSDCYGRPYDPFQNM